MTPNPVDALGADPNAAQPPVRVARTPGMNAALDPTMVTAVLVGEDENGQRVVMLRAETQVGMLMLLFTPQHCDVLADELKRGAAMARSGIEIAKAMPGARG